MDSNEWETRFRLMIGANWFVSIACQIAIIAAIATIVRRQRPDAWKTIFAWSIAVAAMWLWSPLSHFLFPVDTSSGISSFYRNQVITQMVSIPLHVAIVVLLIRGLIKLAQPPPPPVMPNEPPYR